MPLHLVRWPDMSVSLVKAQHDEELFELLDQESDPSDCHVTRYNGPVHINFKLAACPVHHKGERPAAKRQKLDVSGNTSEDSSINKRMDELFLNASTMFSDVTFKTRGGEVVQAHRAVLAQNSEFFKARFLGPWATTGTQASSDASEVELDVPAEPLRATLRWLYSRNDDFLDSWKQQQEIQVCSSQWHRHRIETTIETLRVGHFLDLSDFVQVCEERLMRDANFPELLLLCAPVAWHLNLTRLQNFLIARACFNTELLDPKEVKVLIVNLPLQAKQALDAERAKHSAVPLQALPILAACHARDIQQMKDYAGELGSTRILPTWILSATNEQHCQFFGTVDADAYASSELEFDRKLAAEVSQLIALGAGVEESLSEEHYFGWTALMLAAYSALPRTVEALLVAGSNPMSMGGFEESASSVCERRLQEAMVFATSVTHVRTDLLARLAECRKTIKLHTKTDSSEGSSPDFFTDFSLKSVERARRKKLVADAATVADDLGNFEFDEELLASLALPLGACSLEMRVEQDGSNNGFGSSDDGCEMISALARFSMPNLFAVIDQKEKAAGLGLQEVDAQRRKKQEADEELRKAAARDLASDFSSLPTFQGRRLDIGEDMDDEDLFEDEDDDDEDD